MKIKNIQLKNFKRFTDLEIKEIPETAKLVVLIGPNGCGKSSIFDAFKTWYDNWAYARPTMDDYYNKSISEKKFTHDLVDISFCENEAVLDKNIKKGSFYFRTAHRNSPKITLQSLSGFKSPTESVKNILMIDNDDTINENYKLFVSNIVSGVFGHEWDNRNVKELRDQILNKLNNSIEVLFDGLRIKSMGDGLNDREIYFEKGSVGNFKYSLLSGGEKAAFDLLFDIIVKNAYYQNTIFCIDEPESHIHTSLQSKLLNELYKLISDNSQLWIATHSFGMLKEAKRLHDQNPEQVVFLNFDNRDFDSKEIITPSESNTELWNKMLEITLDDFSTFVMPKRIVLCEGSAEGNTRKNFDARCYANIFKYEKSETVFYSWGCCNDIKKDKQIRDFIKAISPKTDVVRLIDRDNMSDNEIQDKNKEGLTVLSKRSIESYLLDDEVIIEWCKTESQEDKIEEAIKIKNEELVASLNRGNPKDDYKAISNAVCVNISKLLGNTQAGSKGTYIMRDTLSKLIKPEMEVYKALHEDIFGE